MHAHFQVEIMMALEEKFDLTLDEEGKCQINCISFALLCTFLQVCINVTFLQQMLPVSMGVLTVCRC